MTHFIHHQITDIETNPETTGTKLTIGHFLLGLVFGIIKDGHINPLLMEILQCIVWSMSILIAFITLFGYIKKWLSQDADGNAKS